MKRLGPAILFVAVFASVQMENVYTARSVPVDGIGRGTTQIPSPVASLTGFGVVTPVVL